MLIIISPAKSLNFDKKFNCEIFTKPAFEKESKILAENMQKFSEKNLENLQKISPKLAELNFERWQNFNQNKTRQALLAFDGDVYDGFEKDKFKKADFEFAQNHLRILSGLYGLLKPLDLMAPYRLEMGTDFQKFKFISKNLYEFWGDKIANELEKSKESEILNLASQEYFAAINLKKLQKKIINIHFKDEKNGALKTIGINSKKMRGLMANYAILHRIEDAKKLQKFSAMNYVFSKELSTPNNWIFVR